MVNIIAVGIILSRRQMWQPLWPLLSSSAFSYLPYDSAIQTSLMALAARKDPVFARTAVDKHCFKCVAHICVLVSR